MSSIKFSRIQSDSFMPYKNGFNIDLSQSTNLPLTVIHGSNETGKSSFFYSIKWAWYGKSKTGKEYHLIHLKSLTLITAPSMS